MPGHSAHLANINDDVRHLTEDEIDQFLDVFDAKGDGFIRYEVVESKLDMIHDETTSDFLSNRLPHGAKQAEDRHAFLRSMIGSDVNPIPRDQLASRVKEWSIPSMKQDSENEQDEHVYLRSIGAWRRFRSYWLIRGPEIMFLVLVIGLMVGSGVWQMVTVITDTRYEAAFGWGVVLAKTCAGALYPTMFFLLISMSRYLSTLLRRSFYVSRIVNWDLSQSFHIKMSIVTIILATLHAIGHLSGTFVFGSRQSRETAVEHVLGSKLNRPDYIDYIHTLPGVTGLTALCLLYLVAILSAPQVRRRNFELFQLAHMLMYPIIGLMMAHGTAALLQSPKMGYFLALPTFLILAERVTRTYMGFRHILATIRVLDSETVGIKISIPGWRLWQHRPGQYVILQVPTLSLWQWHPFTVSVSQGNEIRLHIKTDGNWTKRLRGLAQGSEEVSIEIGLSGPFGAPAERFYEYPHTVLVGAGIGVTPFAGILADLQTRENRLHGGPKDFEEGQVSGRSVMQQKPVPANQCSASQQTVVNDKPEQRKSETRIKNFITPADSDGKTNFRFDSQAGSRGRSRFSPEYRRVDFHWIVRNGNHLGWFSNLLNSVSRSQLWHRTHKPDQLHLDIRLQTHLTQSRKDIATHVCRWLLELHRTEEHPESPLTGLINPTRFGRPDFVKILDRHYEDMVKYRDENDVDEEKLKVGVFFCGAPIVGETLADRCSLLTARGRNEGTRVQYDFMIE